MNIGKCSYTTLNTLCFECCFVIVSLCIKVHHIIKNSQHVSIRKREKNRKEEIWEGPKMKTKLLEISQRVVRVYMPSWDQKIIKKILLHELDGIVKLTDDLVLKSWILDPS